MSENAWEAPLLLVAFLLVTVLGAGALTWLCYVVNDALRSAFRWAWQEVRRG